MKIAKLVFSALTLLFAILGLTRVLSSDLALPITFVGLAVTMFLNAKEYKDKQQKRSAFYFLLVGIFLLLVTAYNVASIIWGI